jgi:hypothetical protein
MLITATGSTRGLPAPLSARGVQPPRFTRGLLAPSVETAEIANATAIAAANAIAGTSLSELDDLLAQWDVAQSPEEVLAVRLIYVIRGAGVSVLMAFVSAYVSVCVCMCAFVDVAFRSEPAPLRRDWKCMLSSTSKCHLWQGATLHAPW